jgi:hypothetical protein
MKEMPQAKGNGMRVLAAFGVIGGMANTIMLPLVVLTINPAAPLWLLGMLAAGGFCATSVCVLTILKEKENEFKSQ